jgi:hypothetical protein
MKSQLTFLMMLQIHRMGKEDSTLMMISQLSRRVEDYENGEGRLDTDDDFTTEQEGGGSRGWGRKIRH